MRRWYERRIREAVAAAGKQEMTEAAAMVAAAAVSAAEAAVAAAVMREKMVGVESGLVVAELGRIREMQDEQERPGGAGI